MAHIIKRQTGKKHTVLLKSFFSSDGFLVIAVVNVKIELTLFRVCKNLISHKELGTRLNLF